MLTCTIPPTMMVTPTLIVRTIDKTIPKSLIMMTIVRTILKIDHQDSCMRLIAMKIAQITTVLAKTSKIHCNALRSCMSERNKPPMNFRSDFNDLHQPQVWLQCNAHDRLQTLQAVVACQLQMQYKIAMYNAKYKMQNAITTEEHRLQ